MKFILLFFCMILFQMTNSYAVIDYILYSSQVNESIDACSSQDIESEFLITELRAKYKDYPKKNIRFFGVELQAAQTPLVEIMMKLLMINNFSKSQSYESMSNLNMFFSGLDRCRDIFCVADQVFGENLGVFYLYFLDMYNLNLSNLSNSHIKDVNSDLLFLEMIKFNKRQLKVIYRSLRMMPKSYFQQFHHFIHMKNIDTNKNSDLANSAIKFFRMWSKESDQKMIKTVLHELGHRMEDYLAKSSVDKSEEWSRISNWTFDKNKENEKFRSILDESKHNFISNYAKLYVYEDFAESFAAYLLTPSRLEKVALNKYLFMKNNVFGHDAHIDGTCIVNENKEDDITKELNKKNIQELNDIAGNCKNEFVWTLDHLQMKRYNQCIARELHITKFLPLSYSLEILSKKFNKNENYKKIVEFSAEIVALSLKNPLLCKTHILSMFDSQSYSLKIALTTKNNLCRWVFNRAKLDDKTLNIESFEKTLKEIIVKRAIIEINN